ncbi:MAG: 3-dehydroquinate synthase II [Euryarchaeota archaeon]|nr:3-dehydroquinate synthase II [Euryarchaeota archaeon]
MKRVWVKADEGPWEERKHVITRALESGADCVLVNAAEAGAVKALGTIRVAAFDDGNESSDSSVDIRVIGKNGEGDGTLDLPRSMAESKDYGQLRSLTGETAAYIVVSDKAHERFAHDIADACDHLIVIGTDWKIIPLENLIAALKEKVDIIAGVQSFEEAKTALETLEHGADGVLIDTTDPTQITQTVELAHARAHAVELVPATVTTVKPVGMGDRVCVDTCSLMTSGEGMLIGSGANGFFLVHAETEESPYVAPRPFRVNAGPVHAYIYGEGTTRYLSELKAGDEVMIVRSDGETRHGVIGRVKIERRPLMLVEAEVAGTTVKTLLQNAETIKLIRENGAPVSVTALKPGDVVLVHYEGGGRHFGISVEETLIER